MKALFLLGVSCLLGTSTVAQTEKGARFIGANLGNLSYATAKQQPTRYSVALYPTAGVFVANNVLLGAALGIAHERYKIKNVSGFTGYSAWEYGLTPFVRLYLPGAGAHRFFGQLQAGVSRYTYRENLYRPSIGGPNDVRSTDTYGMAAAALGYNYFLTPGAALEVTAGYTRNFTDTYNVSKGEFNIRAGFSVFLSSKQAASVPAQ